MFFFLQARAGFLDIKKIFSDADMFEYGEKNKIGRLYFTHKDYRNDTHSKKNTLVYVSSVCYGNTFLIQVYANIAKSDKKPHKAKPLGYPVLLIACLYQISVK